MHFPKPLFSPPENGVPAHAAGVVGTQTCWITCVLRPARSACPVTLPWPFCDLSHSRPQTHQTPVEPPPIAPKPCRALPVGFAREDLAVAHFACVPMPCHRLSLLRRVSAEVRAWRNLSALRLARGAVAECCPAWGLLVGPAFPTGSAMPGEGVSWSLLPYFSCFCSWQLTPVP